MFIARKPKKKNLKKLGKKAEKLLTRFKKRFPELIQNTTAKDWAELAIMGAVGILGWDTFKDWKGGVFGVVSYKMATTPGGTPPVSQVVGVAGLATIGVCSLYQEKINEAIKVLNGEPIYTDTTDPYIDPETNQITCPEGYKLVVSRFAGAARCVKI